MTGPAVATKQTISNPNAPKEQAEGLASLRALRDSDKILYAQNVSDKPISCRERNGAIHVDFLLEVGELAIIPKEALYIKGFIKCWQRHELVISDDENMENQFLLDLDGRVSESQRMQESALAALQPNPTNNDIEQVVCLMHHPGGQDRPVLQRVADKRAGIPPLCDQHKGFAHQFAGTQQPDGSWTFHQIGGVSR